MAIPLNIIATGFPRCGTQSFAQYILRCTNLRYIRDPITSSMDYSAFAAGNLTDYFQSALSLGRATFHKNNSYILNGEFTTWFENIPEIKEKTHIIILAGDCRSRLISWYRFHKNNKDRALEAGEEPSNFLKSLNTDSIETYYQTFAKYGLNYRKHLERVVGTFGAERIHVILQKDLQDHPYETIGALARNLGFEVTNTSRIFSSNNSSDLKEITFSNNDLKDLEEELSKNDLNTRLYCDEHALTVTPLKDSELLCRISENNAEHPSNQFELQTVSLDDDNKTPLGSVIVVGNGPSAALLDFSVLDSLGVHTVGMNSAYRLWNKIAYRPTYYACLDTVVIMSHADAIYELVTEGKIKKFLLRDEILAKYPNLKGHSSIEWYSDISQDPFKPIFSTDWITTGSWSIRWMAHLGYQLIGCIGIDAKYVQIIDEAKATDGSILEITKTPPYNPNYFFDGYQLEGDAYNVPNDPVYTQLQGGTVHQDALLQARQDVDVYSPKSIIFDLSPISDHGAFAKCSLRDFVSHCSAVLLTTFFYSEGKEDEFRLNIKALCHNLSVLHFRRVVLLFEGELDKGLGFVEPNTREQILAAIRSGKLVINQIKERPNYSNIISAGSISPSNIAVVANSDIIFEDQAISNILAHKSKSSPQTIFALTRWNITESGNYPQGQVPTPPWQEKKLEEMKSLADINFLSYDTYVFDYDQVPLDILSQIFVGTFGCDTAIAAILRVSGFYITNPCISLKTHHIDNKIRNYSSDSGTKQVKANVAAFYNIFSKIYSEAYGSDDDLSVLSKLDRTIVSIGLPRPAKYLESIGYEYAFMRLFGFTPWSSVLKGDDIKLTTFEIDATSVIKDPDQLAIKIQDCIIRGHFIEFVILGKPGSADYLACFLQDYNLEQVRKELFRYDRQSVCHVDLLNSNERRAFDRSILLIKDIFLRGLYSTNKSIFSRNPKIPHLTSGYIAQSLPRQDNHFTSHELGRPSAIPNAPLVAKYRLLVIDPTPIGSYSATGQIKLAMFGFIEPSMILQVWDHEGDDPGYRIYSPTSLSTPNEVTSSISQDDLINKVNGFQPTLIYFRSTPSERLHVIHHHLTRTLEIPSIIHVMDDWPSRQAIINPSACKQLEGLLRQSISLSCVHLSISHKMSKKYANIYGNHWAPVSNAVDRSVYDASIARLSSKTEEVNQPVRICYMGGLAVDMNAQSLLDISKAISDIRSTGIQVELHVYTMAWYKEWAKTNLLQFDGVSLYDLVPTGEYLKTLSSYHCSIIAYNFDDITVAYTSLSMANKLPEILSSGAHLFCYGPRSIATIEYINENKLGCIVYNNNFDELKESLLNTVVAISNGSILKKHLDSIKYSRGRHSLPLLHATMNRYFELAAKSI